MNSAQFWFFAFLCVVLLFCLALSISLARDVRRGFLKTINKIDRIIMKQSELQAAFDALTAQIATATQELSDEIAKLETNLGDVPIPDAAQASFDALKAKVGALAALGDAQTSTTTTSTTTPAAATGPTA